MPFLDPVEDCSAAGQPFTASPHLLSTFSLLGGRPFTTCHNCSLLAIPPAAGARRLPTHSKATALSILVPYHRTTARCCLFLVEINLCLSVCHSYYTDIFFTFLPAGPQTKGLVKSLDFGKQFLSAALFVAKRVAVQGLFYTPSEDWLKYQRIQNDVTWEGSASCITNGGRKAFDSTFSKKPRNKMIEDRTFVT